VVADRRVAPRLLDLTIRSPVLGTTAAVRLLTPEGFQGRRRGRRWPVLYLLHGRCDTYESWTRETDVEELRRLRDVLVVMPEGGEVGFYAARRREHFRAAASFSGLLNPLPDARFLSASSPASPRNRTRSGAIPSATAARGPRTTPPRFETDFYGAGAHASPCWERGLRRALPLLLGALELR
jgi:hypothetical protein